MRTLTRVGTGTLLALFGALVLAQDVAAQNRGGREGERSQVQIEVTFSTDEAAQIRAYYGSNPQSGIEALPPGIRKNLARGKPLPPGIAKKALPARLEQTLPVHDGYQRLQVGLDVFLVEVATGIIHDVLMDVIR